MTEHPLTDKICRDIANNLCFRWPPHVDHGEVLYAEDDMRAAYDLGRDVQLEHVIEWLKDHAAVYMYEAHDGPCFDEDGLLDDFKKAMRPQEDNS